MIRFQTTLFTINARTILRLPEGASRQLSSRGLVMVRGTINDHDFQTALEPDGKGGHWFEVEAALRQAAGVSAGDTVTLAIEQTKQWIEPMVPADIQTGLAADAQANALWEQITPMARWEWIRWIRATNNPETRQKHIEVARSKLRAGNRRPCCFNANMCTVPEVSKSGVLLESKQLA